MVALVLVSGAAYFFQQLAITESERLQIVFCAAASRLVAVFVLSLHILTSIVREFNDKGLELTLSFDVRRSHYVAGRMMGFVLLAFVMALIASVPQFILAPAREVIQWGISLAFELVVVAALSVFCVMTFTQLMPAAGFVTGFYILSRALSAIQLIGDSPVADRAALSHQVMVWLVDALALVLPALDRFTQSAWLVDGTASWTVIGFCVVQATLYATLLMFAAMFDFCRRNI